MARRLLPLLLCALFALNALASIEIEPRLLGPTAGNVSDIASAYAGGKYLIVWRQLFMPAVGIWGAFSDADGNPLGPAFQVLGNANALSLRLFPNGDSFLLMWNEANQSTRMCHVDNSGRATTPKQLDPNWSIRPDTFVDGRVVAVTGSGATIFDDDGATVRSGIAPANGWSLETAFAGNGSFFLAGRWPDLTLSRYSMNGDLLQTFTFVKDQCATTISPCWWIVGLQELGSGRILLLLESQSQQLATMTVAADGTPSEKTAIATSFPQIRSASLRRCGSQIWAVVVGGQKSEGPYDIEARGVDGSGIPASDSVVLLRGVAVYGMAVIAEGPGSLLAVAVAGNYPSQVQTSLFREQKAGDPQIVSITPSIQQNTQVVSNGNNYLAAWSDADGIGFNEVHWAVLEATGQRRSAVFAGGGDMLRHSLVSNGFEYLMLVSYGGPLVARRIAADGTLLGETPLLGAAADWYGGAAVVPASAGYLVVWSSGAVVSSAVVTPSGMASTPQELFRIQGVPQGWAGSYNDPALACNASEVLLVIRRVEQMITYFPGPVETAARLDAFRLRGDGYPLTSDPLQLSSGGAASSPPVAASSGQEFLVASYDERFAIAPTGVATQYQTHTGTTATDLIWDGQTYVLSRAGNTFEHLARDGSTLDGQYRHGVEGLDVAADAFGHLLLGGSESDGVGPLRAHSYTPSDFVPLPKRRRAVSP